MTETELQGNDEFVGDTKFRFKRLSEYKPGESWIHMVYGRSKTGKTYYAGTAGARTLLINIGDGIETLLSPAFTQKYPDSKDMIVIDIRENNPTGAAEAFDMLCDALDHALAHYRDKIDNIVLDEATALKKYALNKATELNTEARRNNASRVKRTEEFMKADIGDYGTEMAMIEWFLGQYTPKFKEANLNFLMLAHERQIYRKPDKPGGEQTLEKVMPGFTGKTFPDTVPAYFDDVWHSEQVGGGSNVVYRFRTAGDERELGGSRHGGIFSVVETNPDFQSFLSKIKAARPLPTRR